MLCKKSGSLLAYSPGHCGWCIPIGCALRGFRTATVQTGGRENAPAEVCRKVAEAEDGTIEVWGDGSAIRSYTYISDMVDGIYALMQSDLEGPVNIGCPQYVTVDELVETVIEVSGKKINVKHIDGPVGVQSRNFSNARIYSSGWWAKVDLRQGISYTYPWIEAQVKPTQTLKHEMITH